MEGLEEVSIYDLLNKSGEDKDTGPSKPEKKYNYAEEEEDDEDNDDGDLNVETDDDADVDDEEEEDAEIGAEQYEKGPNFKENETDDTANINTLPSFIAGGGNDEDDDDEDDEEDEDTNYLQKFDRAIRENFIEKQHPESKNHNFEEVKHMSRVVRNENGIIIDNLHKTLPFLTKYEMTRILGQRAKQLNSGAKSFVKIPPNVIDGYEIAKLELEEKKIPFIIKRPIPDGTCEYWNVSDLEVL